MWSVLEDDIEKRNDKHSVYNNENNDNSVAYSYKSSINLSLSSTVCDSQEIIPHQSPTNEELIRRWVELELNFADNNINVYKCKNKLACEILKSTKYRLPIFAILSSDETKALRERVKKDWTKNEDAHKEYVSRQKDYTGCETRRTQRGYMRYFNGETNETVDASEYERRLLAFNQHDKMNTISNDQNRNSCNSNAITLNQSFPYDSEVKYSSSSSSFSSFSIILDVDNGSCSNETEVAVNEIGITNSMHMNMNDLQNKKRICSSGDKNQESSKKCRIAAESGLYGCSKDQNQQQEDLSTSTSTANTTANITFDSHDNLSFKTMI